MIAPARRVAFQVVRRVFEDDAYTDRVFDGAGAEWPEGPLKHSSPDWIQDVWVRDFGEEEALALERAQNEPPPLEDYRGMSRASRLAAEVVQSQPGERVLDTCAAPGNKTMLLA